jgi:hypothetical protein
MHLTCPKVSMVTPQIYNNGKMKEEFWSMFYISLHWDEKDAWELKGA